MTTSGNTFGRYTLLGRIAVGGMAEVYRGKFTGEKGFEKPVVIKKMLPQIDSDEQMVRFFIDEARLSALLQHENIVCTYDFGELEGTYFIAMEDLQGQDLNTVLKKAVDIGCPPNLGNILWITSRLCNGLEYAHTLKDLKGRPLNIIHRDISPQNVYITYEGNVKILDFGVAKTAMQTTRTRIGIAKGKMAYMSPEQLDAKTIDHRSDIFAVGILLYELVTQSRMYSGDTTTEIFEQVAHAEFEPPEDRNPILDPNLAAIINKALQKDPANRFQSCHEMEVAIEDCIFQLSLRPGNKTLSEYVISLFPDSYSLSRPQRISEKDNSTHDSGGAAFIMDKTERLYQKTVAVDYDNGTTANDAGALPSSTSESNRPWGSQPKVKTPNDPEPVKHWKTGSKVKASVPIAVILLAVIFSIGFYFFKQAFMSEKTLKLSQKAKNSIGTNQLTTPEHDAAASYYKVPKPDHDSNAVTKEYEEIAGKYADLAETAMKQFQYGHAGSLTAKGLEVKPDDARLLGLNKQIKQELLQKAESCIQSNRLTTPKHDSALFYYNEVLKLFPDSDAPEKGYEKIAGKYADLAEGALKQFQYGYAGSLTTEGLVVKPDDARLMGLNKQIKQELLHKAENCIQSNRLIAPKQDSAAFYYNEVLKLFPDSDAAEKGYGKIAGKYADLAENAMKQFQFDRARFLTAKGLEFMPDDARLLSLNKQLSTNKVGLFFKNIGRGIKDTID